MYIHFPNFIDYNYSVPTLLFEIRFKIFSIQQSECLTFPKIEMVQNIISK